MNNQNYSRHLLLHFHHLLSEILHKDHCLNLLNVKIVRKKFEFHCPKLVLHLKGSGVVCHMSQALWKYGPYVFSDINGVISISYLIIGFVLSLYWFDKEYEESYNAAVIGGEVDKGMSSIMMICLMRNKTSDCS